MTTATKQYRVRIDQDSDQDGPRDWNNLGTMATWASRYRLGDEQPTESADEYLRGLVDAEDHASAEHVQAELDKQLVILPLYLYDHSGITMNTTGFSCPWGSGQVGYIYCTLKDARANWTSCKDWTDTMPDWRDKDKTITLREATERALRGEVETYDQYLRGDVYGFVLEQGETCEDCEHTEWEEVDSCWGFYGTDPAENGMMDHIGDRVSLEDVREAFENIQYN